MLRFNNNKKGISVAALSVAAIVIISLAAVITVSLTRNYNDAKKIEFAQELNMIKMAVDNYYYENGTYPVSNKQITMSNLSEEEKQSQFLDEQESNELYTFSLIDYNLLGISSLKYGKGISDIYDSYVVSTSTGNVYYVKGLKIDNKTYYTLNSELNALLSGNNKLDINSDSAILFSEQKLDDGSVSVRISVPTDYEVSSVKFENEELLIKSKQDNYYIYEVQAENSGTINVDYNYNSVSKNAKYTVLNEKVEVEETVFNLIIRLSTEEPTVGPISASITSDSTLPYGYIIQYKIDDGTWTNGNKINDIDKNGIIYARLYNSNLDNVIAENKKI